MPIAMTRLLAAITLVTGVVTPALADLEGRYDVEGRNPGGEGTYTGEAAVQQQNGVYKVAWQVGAQEYVGTGLKEGEVFAVVYAAPGEDARPGLVIYRIQDDGTLLGTWTPLGGRQTGAERWTPMDNP